MDLIDKRDEILRTFLEYGIVPNIENDLTKNDLDDCAEKIVENLYLSGVSQQREPLLAYHKHLDSFNDPTIYNASESMIDDYLANNCG